MSTDSEIKLGFKSCLALGAFRALRAFVRLLKPEHAAALGGAIAHTFGRFFSKELKICRVQLAFAASRAVKSSRKLREQDLQSIPLNIFRHLGQCLVELFFADRLLEELPQRTAETPWAPAFKHISFEADPRLEPVLQERIPAVALTGHIGCFELLAPFYTKIGYKVSVFRRLSNYPLVDTLHADFLAWTEAEVLWRDDSATKKKLFKALKDNNRVIAALIDQDIDLDNSFAPFFGVEAAAPATIVRLAIRMKTPIFSTFIVRTSPLRHKVVIDVLDYDPDDPNAITKVLIQYNTLLEELIARYPEQWVWWHRRWRRRPGVDYRADPNALRGTKRYLAWLSELTSSVPANCVEQGAPAEFNQESSGASG